MAEPPTTPTSAPPLRQVEHIGIRVRDLDASVAFYRDVLGLPLVERKVAPSGNELVFLAIGSAGLVELVKSPAGFAPALPVPPAQAGLQHFAMEVESLDDWLGYLKAKNVPLAAGPFDLDLPSAACRGLFVTDPDGTPVELFERRRK